MYSTVQKVSYQSYLREQKVKLNSRYPFLTKSQINKKVKDMWNKLAREEQQQYLKRTLTRTPIKAQKRVSSKQLENQGRWKSFETPEQLFIDDQFSSNFDSITDGKSKLEPEKCINEILTDPVLSNTMLNKSSGILKHDSYLKKKTNSRVSFCHKYVKEKCKDKRAAQSLNTDSFKHLPVNTESYLDSSDDEAILISRTEADFDEIENYQMLLENDEGADNSVLELNTKLRNVEDKSQNRPLNIQKLEKNIKSGVNKSKSNDMEQKNDKKPMSVSKVSKKMSFSPGNSPRKNSEQQLMSSSPKQKEKKSNKRKNKCQKRKSPRNQNLSCKSPEENLIVKHEIDATPVSGIENPAYKTPLMEESTQNSELLSKAPRKRRSSIESRRGILTEDKQALKKQKKNGKLSLQTTLSVSQLNYSEFEIQEKNSNQNKAQQGSLNSKIMESETNIADKGDVKRTFKVDASGDAKTFQKEKVNKKDEHQILQNVTKHNRVSYRCTREISESDMNLSMKNSPKMSEETVHSSVDISDIESLSSESTDWMDTRPTSTNPTLQKTLSMMKRTVVSPPRCSIMSGKNIISPALSGISMLSSLSSCSSENVSQINITVIKENNHLFHPPCKDHIDQTDKSKVREKDKGKGLCAMFQNLTPPERRVTRANKNARRVISSAVDQTSSNFSSMFKAEDIFTIPTDF